MYVDLKENNFIQRFFRLAIRLMSAYSQSDFDAVQTDIKEFPQIIKTVNLTASTPPEVKNQTQLYLKELYLFQKDLNQVLILLSARQAKHLNLSSAVPVDESMLSRYEMDLASFSVANPMADYSWLRILRLYVLISVNITQLSQSLIDESANNAFNKTKIIICLIYELKVESAKMKYHQNTGLSAEFFDELCHDLSSMVQSTTIDDSPPDTLIKEYSHYLIRHLVDFMLQLQEKNKTMEQLELALHVNSVENSLQVQKYRDQNSLINAMLWRLNLQAKPHIRKVLLQDVNDNSVNGLVYLSEKMHRDKRRRMVVSTLINETKNPHHTPLQHDLQLKEQLVRITMMLHAHIEDCVELVKTYHVLHGATHLDYLPIDGLKNLQKITALHLVTILYDAELVKNQCKAVISDPAACDSLVQKLSLIIHMSCALVNLVSDNEVFQKGLQKRILGEFILAHVHLEDLTSDGFASGVHSTVKLYHQSLLEHAGSDAVKRADVFKIIVKDLEFLLLKKNSNVVKTQHLMFVHSLIKDCFLHALIECRNPEERDYLYRDNLKTRIQQLSVQANNQRIYEFLYDFYHQCIEKRLAVNSDLDLNTSNIDKGLLLQYFYKCHSKIIKSEPEYTLSSYTTVQFYQQCIRVNSFFKNGMIEPYRSKAINVLKEINTTHFRNLYNNSKTFLSGIAYNNLLYSNPNLDDKKFANDSIEYPKSNTVLLYFFAIEAEISKADTSDKIVKLLKDVTALEKESVNLVFENDAIHLELQAAEQHCIQLLKVLLHIKQGELLVDNNLIDLNVNKTLKNLSRIKIDLGESSIALAMNHVIQLIAALIRFNRLKPDVSDPQQIAKYLIKAHNLLIQIYVSQIELAKSTYKFHKLFSKKYFEGLCTAFDVVHSDTEPQNVIQILCHKHLQKMVQNLVVFRKQLEDYEFQQFNLLPPNKEMDFGSSLFFLTHRNRLAILDALLIRLNLADHQGLRQKYDSHLRVYGVRDEYRCMNWELSSRRILSLSGLVNLTSPLVEVRAKQYKIACSLLFHYTKQCAHWLASMKILSMNKDDNFADFRKFIKEQLECTLCDVRMLLFSAILFTKESKDIKPLSAKFYLIIGAVKHLLNQEFDVYLEDDSDLLGIEISGFHFTQIKGELSSELIAGLCYIQLRQQLNTADTLTRFTVFSKTLAQLKIQAESLYDLQDKPLMKPSRIQFLLDMYVFAYSLCNSETETNLFKKSEFKKIIFELTKKKNYNSLVRDYLIEYLDHSRKLACNGSFNPPNFSNWDKQVVMKLMELLEEISVAKPEQVLIFEGKKKTFKDILPNSQVYIMFLTTVQPLVDFVANTKNGSLKWSKNLNLEFITERKQKIENYLKADSKLFFPANLSYRPINCLSIVGQEIKTTKVG